MNLSIVRNSSFHQYGSRNWHLLELNSCCSFPSCGFENPTPKAENEESNICKKSPLFSHARPRTMLREGNSSGSSSNKKEEKMFLPLVTSLPKYFHLRHKCQEKISPPVRNKKALYIFIGEGSTIGIHFFVWTRK